MPVAYQPGETRTPPKPKKNPQARRQAIREIRAATREISRATRTAAATPSNALGPKAATHAAVREFMRTHGPIGQRTTGQYTPWQVRERKERRAQRRRTTEFMADLGGVTVAPEAPAPRGPVRTPQLGNLNVGDTFRGQARMGVDTAGTIDVPERPQRDDMPGSILRTPNAQEFRANRAKWDQGLWHGLESALVGTGKGLYGAFDVVTGIPTFVAHPSLENAGWAAASVLPVGWVVSGSRAGARVARALGRATREGLPTRTFAAGALEVSIPAAGSRTGRLVENVVDSLRPQRWTERRAAAELERTAQNLAKVKLAPAKTLQRVGKHLNAAEQVALRLMAENAPLAKQAEAYRAAIGKATTAEARAYLGIHDRLIGQASEFLIETPNGIAFSERAPRHLRQAWELLTHVGATREQIYKKMGLLTDERIAARLNAPGRKLLGAQYVPETIAERYARYSERGREFLIGAHVRPRDRNNLGTIVSLDPKAQTAEVHFLNHETGEEATKTFSLADLFVASGKGKLVGAEDFNLGRIYVPDVRGTPGFGGRGVSISTLDRQAAAFVSGGWRRSLTVAGRDKSISHAWTGALRDTGFFRTDVTNLAADALARAIRLDSLRYIRDGLLKASEEAPRGLDWKPIKVNPGLNAPEKLKQFWDKWEQVERGGLDTKTFQRLFGEDVEIRGLLDELFPKGIIAKEGELIPNIRWVPPGMMDQIAALNPMAWRRSIPASRGGKLANVAAGAAGGALDVYNDLQRAAILYLNPAYGPVNLLGNTAMNLMHQGVLYPRNVVRAANLARSLSPEALGTVRGLMGTTLTRSLDLSTFGVRNVTGRLGQAVSVLSDAGPRWTAFVHEASKAGVRKTEEFEALFQGARQGSPDAERMVDYITRKAKDAIVDYDRLGPFERNIVTRVVFFYPWLKGAARYTKRFPLEHPVQTAGLAYGGYEARQYANEKLGSNRPWYAMWDVPIPGMSDAQGNPYVFSARQLLTPTTPIENALAVGGYFTGNADAPQVLGQLTPGLQNLVTSLTGVDELGREVGKGPATFFRQSWQDLPPARIYRGLTEPRPDEDSLYPRTRTDEAVRIGLGGLAPKPFNIAKNEEYNWDAHLASLPPDRRQIAKAAKVREEWQQLAVRAGLAKDGEPMPPELKLAFSRAAQRAARREKILDRLDHKGKEPYTLKELRSLTRGDIQLLHEWGETDDATYRRQLQWAARASEDDLHRARNRVSDKNGSMTRAFGGLLNATRKQLEDAGIPMSDIPEPVR